MVPKRVFEVVWVVGIKDMERDGKRRVLTDMDAFIGSL